MTRAHTKSGWQRLRKLALRVAGFCLLILVISCATLPYWMGAALQILAPKDVITIGDYEILGYGRFELSDVEFNTDAISLELNRLEAPSLLNWVYQAATNELEKYVVEAGVATIHLREATLDNPPPESDSPSNVFEALELLKTPL